MTGNGQSHGLARSHSGRDFAPQLMILIALKEKATEASFGCLDGQTCLKHERLMSLRKLADYLFTSLFLTYSVIVVTKTEIWLIHVLDNDR